MKLEARVSEKTSVKLEHKPFRLKPLPLPFFQLDGGVFVDRDLRAPNMPEPFITLDEQFTCVRDDAYLIRQIPGGYRIMVAVVSVGNNQHAHLHDLPRECYVRMDGSQRMHSFCSGRQKLAAIADFAVRNGTIYGPAMYETPIETVNFCSHIEHDPAKIQSGHWKGNPLIPDDERALLTASTRTKTPKDGLTVLLNAFGQIQGRLAEQEEVYVPHFDNAYFTLEPMHPFVLGYSPLRRPDHAIVAKQIGSAIRGAIPVFGKRRMREYADYLNGLVRAA